MLGRAGATPMAAGRDVVDSGVGSEGALPGDRRLRAHMTAEATIQRSGRRERLWHMQRGAADLLGPRMVGRHSSGPEKQAAAGARTRRCGLQTCRVSQMSEVALDKQPKGLRGTHTHAGFSQPRHKIRGPRKPGDRQTEEGCERAGAGDQVYCVV
jgi:hypothetical protein